MSKRLDVVLGWAERIANVIISSTDFISSHKGRNSKANARSQLDIVWR